MIGIGTTPDGVRAYRDPSDWAGSAREGWTLRWGNLTLQMLAGFRETFAAGRALWFRDLHGRTYAVAVRESRVIAPEIPGRDTGYAIEAAIERREG